MKKLISLVILTLFVGWISSDTEVSANTENPPLDEIKKLISDTAREYNIPPEILKAIAFVESDYEQFEADGTPKISPDGGIGIMQITPDNIDITVDEEKLKTDIAYNIEIGAKVLNSKWDLSYLPKINSNEKNVLENWYFAIAAYNGLSKQNDPNVNPGKTYQDDIYDRISKASLLYGNQQYFEFPEFDIRYDGDETMKFPPGVSYKTETITPSQQMYQKGDTVYVDGRDGSVNYRIGSINATPNRKLWPYTPLTITGKPVESPALGNDYAFYPVKAVKDNGFVASAYLNLGDKNLLFSDPVDDQRAAALYFAASNGYVAGKKDGSFGSGDKLKRDHVAVILDNILDLEAPASYKMKADDVAIDHPYYEQLKAVEYYGYLGGGGKLRPNEYLTRSQMAQVLVEAFGDYYKEPTSEHIFKDHGAIWNPTEVNILYQNEITVADPFRPNEHITRSQFAIFIYRTMVDF